jgi:acetyl-CoA carboxylase biotin carboxyl carrier protein
VAAGPAGADVGDVGGSDGTAGVDAGGSAGAGEAAAKPEDGLVYVTAPMVGMFYRASGPDEPAFVEPGAEVAEDDVVCLIEVMKLFNSITAGTKGRVKEVLAENGVMVEYGQRLLAIEPAEGG